MGGTREFGVGSGGRSIRSDCPLSAWAVPAMLPLSFSHRQLDKNQISCIEDGAFRALRGLEVL